VTGINIYSTKLFEDVNVPATIGSIIVGFSQLIGCLIGGILINAGAGYRTMMVYGQYLMGLLLLLVGYFAQHGMQWPLVICISLFLTVYQAV
jgi:hypothetical protein